ncbi:helix-turn-helix transcriptional regulator [uncultured Anaerococcus sp.]|uniref:helix-turn-helix transcriptional regulator n=1 Tax=uncultured Anaerococcus sp. TaxID=293428 RepID=UPI0026249966|nr:helix-turn-helix transcriptional regulator [uncultured Anaerococcus sp.]
MLLKNKLAEFRKEKNINQTDLGKRIGVSRQTISLIERGDYNPSVMVALSLAKVFSVNVEDIFSLEDDYEKAL